MATKDTDQDTVWGALGAESTSTEIRVSAGGTLRAANITIGGRHGGLEIDGNQLPDGAAFVITNKVGKKSTQTELINTNGQVYLNGKPVH
jgi:hypothetical protein